MAIPVRLKRSGTSSAAPAALVHGEVALNYADGKVFWKDASNVIRSFVFQSYALASHAHDASALTSGTVAAARLGTGTASSSTYLRGDGAWATVNAPTPNGGGASGTWGINVTGNAGTATYATYQSASGTANNWNLNFSETPADKRSFREMNAGGPQGAWWFVENLRHSNASNQWGRQNAWGWEDNANELWSRNVQNGAWGSWVRFLHSGNYGSYAPTLTGGGASGTWAINVTGTAGSISGFGNPTAAATANTIAYRDGNADSTFRYVFSVHVNMSHAASNRNADTVFYSSTDNYLRKNTATGMRSSLNVPTRTGGDASGTWGISVTGTAGSETLATVCSRGANASGSAITVNSVYAGNWFRSTGNSGWYSETHGGGIWMSDATWVRVYNNKQFYADNIIQSGNSVRAPIFYDSQNTAWYVDPNGTSRLQNVDCDSLVVRGNHLYIGDATTAAYVYVHFRDSDEGERLMHCNSNRIGFLNQSGGWGSWCYDDGSWGCYGGGNRALEAIGGWGQYGITAEVRCDNWAGNGLQDGPRIWYHKAGVKSWAAGVEPHASNGWAVWEDGTTGGFGTPRLSIDPGGSLRHNGKPAFMVRAWCNFSADASPYVRMSGNVSSVTYRSAVGKFRINFATPIPCSPLISQRPASFGSVSNGSDAFTNTTMRFGSRADLIDGIGWIDVNIVTSGGQGVPSASNAMSDCHYMVVS
jgi:hypothetical protein